MASTSSIIPVSLLGRQHCCQNQCLGKFSYLDFRLFRHDFFKLPSKLASEQCLLDYLTSHECLNSSGEYNFKIREVQICTTAFLKCIGFTRSRFFNVKKKHLAGIRNFAHGNAGRMMQHSKREAIIAFLQYYIAENSEPQPDNPSRHLPSCTRISEMFLEFRLMYGSSASDESISERYFRQVFTENFPSVKIPAENRFSRCDICSKIKESYAKIHQSNDIKRSKLKEYEEWHRKMASNQRHDFHNQIQRAFAYPELEMCITTDGMDQLKVIKKLIDNAAILEDCYSTISKSHLLKIHVMGSMCFHKSTICYLDIMEFLHDSNLNTNVILQTIFRHNDALPRKIHIQLDNTCRENKNQFVFHFLAYLVESKIFDELTVGFLMKGHTHSQIDQYFSRLSTYIGSSARGILTYEQFCSAVKECFKKNLEKNAVIPTIVGLENSDESMTPIISRPARMLVDAVRLRKIYALREWLIPFSNKLKNLHPYHHFWFFRDGNGKAVMKFKKWATDAYSLKNLIILNNLPQSSPLLIVPSKEKVDFIKLQQTVLKAEQVGALTKEEKEEWSNFLTNEEEYFAKYAGYELLKEEDSVNRIRKIWNNICCSTFIDRGIQHKRDINYCIDPDDFDIVKKLVARMSESGDQPAIPEALRQARSELETVTKDVCVEPNSNRAIQKSKEKLFKNSFLIINPDIDWCLSQSYSLLDLEEKPWLCRALTEPNEDGLITVQWYTGSVKSTWSVMKVKRQNRKGMINYTTTIDKESVMLSHFRLKNKMIPSDAYDAIASDLKKQCTLYKSRIHMLSNNNS